VAAEVVLDGGAHGRLFGVLRGRSVFGEPEEAARRAGDHE
jgi:hypothetical protein